MSQLMKDLYDSMERETDLKDQLRFAEEETKSMRKKLEELEDENDNLSQQLKKMSAAQATRRDDVSGQLGDKPEVSETEAELTVQLELNEQELLISKKKIQDIANENEKFLEEMDLLKKSLREKDSLLQVMPEPSSPNAYYEDKLKEVKLEMDELRWKVIEKDREIDSLYAQVNVYQSSQSSKLRKSRSLDNEYSQVVDLRKQIDYLYKENSVLQDKINILERENTQLHSGSFRIESQVFERSSPHPTGVYNDQQTDNHELLETDAQTMANVQVPFSNTLNAQNLGISADVVILQVESSVESGGNEESKPSEPQKVDDSINKEVDRLKAENAHLQSKVSSLEQTIDEGRLTCKTCQKNEDQKGESREELMETILDMEDEIGL